MKKLIKIIFILCLGNNLSSAQSNTFPTTGTIKIFDYSPLVILQRNTAEGGFVQGIQTKFQDGTDNWYFGNLHSDSWIVSKGGYQNPKMVVLENGNVGIGTANPLFKLNVEGNHGDSRILLHSIGGGTDDRQADLMLWASEPEVTYTGVGIGNNVTVSTNKGVHLLNPVRGGSYIRLLDNSMSFGVVSSTGAKKQSLNLDSEGNVGIGLGSNTPIFKLDILGPNGNGVKYKGESGVENVLGVSAFAGQIGTISNNRLDFLVAGTEKVSISTGGNVGIGTTNPNNKLDVNGTIHSKEIKVDMNGWSDFVFKKEYNLPTLEEVEKHINEKGHLENIPSEKEVLKNGINLGEMNAKLLQKIEELMLYMIEMKKETVLVKNENQKIKNENELIRKNQIELEKRILNIEYK
jgi:hypothetical protein